MDMGAPAASAYENTAGGDSGLTQLQRAGPWLILLVYATWISLVLPEHEPWTDEAQSWLLARDASIPDLLFKYLRYEGTPGLWHLLLAVPAKLGLPYFALNVVGALCALSGVFLLVRFSPFPLWLKALLPFSYFLGYQYAIVARNYCLLAPLLFLTAILYRTRAQSYWSFALSIFLLSHISLHATLMAGAIWLFEVGGLFTNLNRISPKATRGKRFWLAILAINFCLIIWQLWPPSDLSLRPPFKLHESWQIFLTANREAFSLPWGFAFAFLLALAPLLYVRRTLGLFLTGFGFLLALMCFRYYSVWHTGTLTIFALFSVWLALDRRSGDEREMSALNSIFSSRMALTALGIFSLLQVSETALAGWHDFEMPYSGSKAAAEFLKETHLDQARINALDIHSFAVLPYFDQNFFANYKDRLPGSFWIWSRDNERRFTIEGLTDAQPEYLFISAKPRIRYIGGLDIPGYRPIQTFPGRVIWKSGAAETDAYLLYQRMPQ